MPKGENIPVQSSTQKTSPKIGISRRLFLKGTGAGAAGLTAAGCQFSAATAEEQNAAESAVGPDPIPMTLRVNDHTYTLHLDNGTVRDARVVLGPVAPLPIRSTPAEQVLIGNTVSDELATQAGHAATDGAAPLTANGYKVPLLAELVRRTVLKAASPLSPPEEVTAL